MGLKGNLEVLLVELVKRTNLGSIFSHSLRSSRRSQQLRRRFFSLSAGSSFVADLLALLVGSSVDADLFALLAGGSVARVSLLVGILSTFSAAKIAT